MYAFGAWRPDAAAANSGYAKVADGVVPKIVGQQIGYAPMARLVTASGAEALGGPPRGVHSAQKNDNSWLTFAATETTIEVVDSTYQWTDVETGRSLAADADVSFSAFGAYLLNTDVTNGFKAYNFEVPAGNNAVSGAPAAASVFICNNVVFALGVSTNPRRFQSSGIGDHTAWSSKGADGKTFEDGETLIGSRDLKNGAAIMAQERALRLVQFGTGQGLYSITKIADGRGCVADRTLVGLDGIAFWWDTNGPWKYELGGRPIPIGKGKINEWALTNIGAGNYKNLQGIADPERNLVFWRIDDSRTLVYDVTLDEFTTVPLASSALLRLATPGVTIDNLGGTIDEMSGTIDNRLLAGGALLLGALDMEGKFATFTGESMPATIEGALRNSPITGIVGRATPIDDAPDGTLQIGVTDSIDTAIQWKPGAAKTSSGRTALRARGMNMAFRRNVTAGANWTYILGVDHILPSGGGPR